MLLHVECMDWVRRPYLRVRGSDGVPLGIRKVQTPRSVAKQARKGWQIRTHRLRGGRGLGGAVRGGRDGPIESRPRRYLVDQAPLAPARAAFATCSVTSSSEPPPAESTARSLRGWLDYESGNNKVTCKLRGIVEG